MSSLQNRRQFVRNAIAASTAVGAASLWPRSSYSAGIASQYAGLKSSKYLGKVQTETRIQDKKIFTEGPAVDRAGNVYFTNVPAEKILKWNPNTKELTAFRKESHKANGLLFDPHGNLLACEGGAGRVTKTDMKTGLITVLADMYNGFPFAAPNDLTLDKHGKLYFTSRPGTDDPKKGNPNSVYRIDLDQKQPGGRIVHRLLASPEVHMPNGIVISPDDKTMYLIEAHPEAKRNRSILAFDLKHGELSNRRTLIDFYPGRSGDGMCIDAEGNLYVAAGLHKRRDTSETLDTKPGIHVVSPRGKLLAFVETPEDTITNCTFGAADLRTLYITCGSYLLSVRTEIPGKAAYRPS